MRTRLGVTRRGAGAAGSNNGPPPPLGLSTAGRQSAQSLAVGRLILEVGYIQHVCYFLVKSLRRCGLSTGIITEVLGGRRLAAH